MVDSARLDDAKAKLGFARTRRSSYNVFFSFYVCFGPMLRQTKGWAGEPRGYP